MLNKSCKSRVVFLSVLLIMSNLYSESSILRNKKNYLQFEYDLADYLTNVNGRSEVFINESNEKDCYVELYFYTSMYQVHYYISFLENDFKGFSEKTTYNEPYNLENSKKEQKKNFEGKTAELSKQAEPSRKYISLALKLVQESLVFHKNR